jgi:Phytanoyl-CoA dioxygenase (PhyH)
MWTFRRRRPGAESGGTATAEPPEHRSPAELEAEIEEMTRDNVRLPSRETERRLLELRHQLGLARVSSAGPVPYASPDPAGLGPFGSALPEIEAAELTPELLRAGILRDGSLLVRGLIRRDVALRFAEEIDRAFAEREAQDSGGVPAAGYYQEFAPQPGSGEPIAREWIKMGGGVLAVDSPKLAFSMLQMFADAGLPELVRGYLGEPPLISAQKTTLRKAEPSVPGAWHQDGAFMGPVRALNLWVSLSRCGDEAPGLDIVPIRLDHYAATQTDEAVLDYQVSQSAAEQAAGDRPIVRPIFEPGDALLFDELCLHKTGSDPSMPRPRYAIESWFFGGSAFPSEYAPVAV